MEAINNYNNGNLQEATNLVTAMTDLEQQELAMACENEAMYNFFFITTPNSNHRRSESIRRDNRNILNN